MMSARVFGTVWGAGTTYVELSVSLHLLLLLGGGAESPSAGVEIALHDAALDLGNDTVVAGRELDGRHLGDSKSDGLSLSGNKNNLLIDLNALLVAQETGNHEFGTVADGVDGAVLDDDALISSEERLQRADDAAEVGLITSVVHHPLGIQNVVQSHDVVVLAHRTGPHTSQLLHVSSNAQKQTQVHAERTDVGSSLAADPEDTEVALVIELEQLDLVDGTDTELTLEGRDQRGTLEERTREGLKCAIDLLLALHLVVEANDAYVLLSGTLLRLDETRSAVDADD